ncbi:MAG: hypothetical protein ABJL99_10730 [Aliishimia sp.]
MDKKVFEESPLFSAMKMDFNPSHNPDWKAAYRRFIYEIKRKPTAFVLKDCYEALGSRGDYPGFTKKIAFLPFEEASKVIDYIFDNNIVVNTLTQRGELQFGGHFSVFHGFREFLESDEQDVMAARRELPGTYQIWRRSVSIPGDYVKGVVFIENDPRINVLRVEMIQRFEPIRQVLDNPVRGRGETLSGYIYKQTEGRYVLFLRQVGRKHLRVTFLNEVSHAHSSDGVIEKVDWMSGRVMGLDNNTSMYAPVYLERVSDHTDETKDKAIRHLLQTVNVYETQDVPRNIRKILEAK